MMVKHEVKLPVELVQKYRVALETGKGFAPESKKSTYERHVQELGKLEELLTSGAAIEDMAAHVRNGRRSFGWSFLSGDHGAEVERAFHIFISDIEKQLTN